MKVHYLLPRMAKSFALYLLVFLCNGKLFSQNFSETGNYFPHSLNMHLASTAGNALAQGQTSSTPIRSIVLRPLPTIVPASSSPQYDMHTIQKNLRLDRNLIISGSVIAGFGVCAFGIGIVTAFPGKSTGGGVYDTIGNKVIYEHHPSMGTFIPFSMFLLGGCMVATGVPLLSVGLAQRHKWRLRRDALYIKACLFSGNQMGMVMNF